MALFGAGSAAAQDYVGETYADASDAMSDAGLDPIIASRVGDRLDEDDCIVSNAWSTPFVRGDGEEFSAASGEIMVSLNCAGSFASATNPGTSVQHPLGRAAKSQAEKEAEEQEEQELAEAATPDE